jgi:hypothetical protein
MNFKVWIKQEHERLQMRLQGIPMGNSQERTSLEGSLMTIRKIAKVFRIDMEG